MKDFNYYELNTKNFCALYFTFSQKRHVPFEELGRFYSHLKTGFFEKDKKDVNILFSSYYLSQVCYDYDDLFEMDDQQLSLKKEVTFDKIEKELAWLPFDIFQSSLEISKDFFDNFVCQNLPKQLNSKRDFAHERTL